MANKRVFSVKILFFSVYSTKNCFFFRNVCKKKNLFSIKNHKIIA